MCSESQIGTPALTDWSEEYGAHFVMCQANGRIKHTKANLNREVMKKRFDEDKK